MRKFIIVLCIWTTGCATTSQRYTETVSVVQTCMFNVLYGVLAFSPQMLKNVCDEKEIKYNR